MLTDDHVLPIALGENWIYALPSSAGVLLVDAGPDYDGAWEALTAQLDAAGLAAGDVRTVAITHAHIDHCGLARRWQEEGAEVVGPAAEAERFALGDRVVRFQSELIFRFLGECGVPVDRIESFRERRRARAENMRRPDRPPQRRERWPGFLRGTPFRPDRALEDGDEVRVGDRTLRCIVAPGHTPGNAVFFEEASGALFSGDQLLPHITPNPGIHFSGDDDRRMRSLPAYSRSLERIGELKARRLYPGHGEHSSEVTEAMERTVRHHRRRQERLLRFLREGPQTPYELLVRFFPHLPDGRLWQAMAEVVGHVDALVEAGEVVEEWEEAGLIQVRAAVV